MHLCRQVNTSLIVSVVIYFSTIFSPLQTTVPKLKMDTTLGSNEHPQAESNVETKLLPTKVTEIIGYVEPWIASPGEKVDVKV